MTTVNPHIPDSPTDAPLPLDEEYRLAALENVLLLQDFAFVDFEGWDEEQ